MQLELLKVQRLIALCHNEGANVDEDRRLATARQTAVLSFVCDVSLALSVVPKTQSRSRTRDPGSAKNHNQQGSKNFLCRIHAQLPARCEDGFLEHLKAAKFS